MARLPGDPDVLTYIAFAHRRQNNPAAAEAAYRAALAGLAGKHSLRPWTKYQHAKVGLAKFHGLVETYPESIEIRMLRRPSSMNARASASSAVSNPLKTSILSAVS